MVCTLSVYGTILPLKIDTGAQANLLSTKDYNVLKQRPKLKKRDNNITYNIAFVFVTSDDKTS